MLLNHLPALRHVLWPSIGQSKLAGSELKTKAVRHLIQTLPLLRGNRQEIKNRSAIIIHHHQHRGSGLWANSAKELRSYSAEVSPKIIKSGCCCARCTPAAVANRPSIPDAPRLVNTARPSNRATISAKRTNKLLPRKSVVLVAHCPSWQARELTDWLVGNFSATHWLRCEYHFSSSAQPECGESPCHSLSAWHCHCCALATKCLCGRCAGLFRSN